MNLLYIAPLPIDIDNLGGVPKKVFSQLEALSASFDCTLVYYYQGRIKVYDYSNQEELDLKDGRNRFDVLKAALKIVKSGGIDVAYIRYPKSDNNLIKLCRELSGRNIRFVIEIPTYPYHLEGNETLKGKIINILDRIYRPKLKKYVSRIVTFSSDKEIFGIKTINTINGIDFKKILADYLDVDYKNRIDAIAVSAMYRVHGYDRFIKGLHEYYSKGGKRNILLKLVGSGDKYEEYKSLVTLYKLEKHVLFLGTLLGEALDEAYQGCAVGVNSLAIHRQGLICESTLKTKEYAAKGLPVVSSSYVDAFSKNGNEMFALRIPPDESPVRITEFIQFVDSIYESRSVDNVRQLIRKDGENTCDIRITMKPIIDYLMGSE